MLLFCILFNTFLVIVITQNSNIFEICNVLLSVKKYLKCSNCSITKIIKYE